MISEDRYHHTRRHELPHQDGLLLHYPSSAPASATPEATITTPNNTTNATTSTRNANLRQQREAQLRHVLQHSKPSSGEVSAVASAAYVQALMELIEQHSNDVQQVCTKIDALQAQRASYHTDLAARALRTEEEMQAIRNERSDLTLQLQEERERTTRLLHETTVLHTQQAEQREQLGQLVELCRARGKRLRTFYHHAAKSSNTFSSGGVGRSRVLRRSVADDHGSGVRESEEEEATAGGLTETSPEKGPEVSRLHVGGDAAAGSAPASLSIARASGATATPARGLGSTTGTSFSLTDIGDDAEVAAILGLPYKMQQHHHQPSRCALSGSAPTTAATASVTVSANTAATAHLLAVTAEVNMLRQQLEEQRGSYEQERGARTQEDNARHRHAQEQLARYAATVQQLEALHEESLRDLVIYRHETDKQLRDVHGQVEWLRAALQDALTLAEKDRRRQHNEVYATEQRMSRQYYPKVQSLHTELADFRRTAAAQAKDYAAALAKKDDRIAELQTRLKAETAQRKRVEQRYKLEMEGVHRELDMMRQALRQMERRVYYRGVRDLVLEEQEASMAAGEAAEMTTDLERYYR